MNISVFKVGGSLAQSDAAEVLLRHWRATWPHPYVVVPGGGLFAEAVRSAQHERRFSQAAAHDMALIAMRSMGRMWADLVPGYGIAEDETQMRECWQRGDAPIWAPEKMVLADARILASWDVTSDSLAAWLARRVDAEQLVVVKSCPVPAAWRQDAKRLTEAGIVDAAFGEYVKGLPSEWQVLTWSDLVSS